MRFEPALGNGQMHWREMEEAETAAKLSITTFATEKPGYKTGYLQR